MTRAELAAELERLFAQREFAEYYASPASIRFMKCCERHFQTILAALRDPDEAAVERAAVAFAFRSLDGTECDWSSLDLDIQEMYRDDVRFILNAARDG